MSKIYTQPELEIVLFEEEDIMTASTSEFNPEIFDKDADGSFFA